MSITSHTHLKHLFPVIVGVLLVLYCTILLMSYQAYGQASEAGTIDGKQDKVVANVTVGINPTGVAVDPNTGKAYVINKFSSTVSVIDAKQDKVVANVTVGSSTAGVGGDPRGVAVDQNTGKAYVTNTRSNTVSVIASTKTG